MHPWPLAILINKITTLKAREECIKPKERGPMKKAPKFKNMAFCEEWLRKYLKNRREKAVRALREILALSWSRFEANFYFMVVWEWWSDQKDSKWSAWRSVCQFKFTSSSWGKRAHRQGPHSCYSWERTRQGDSNNQQPGVFEHETIKLRDQKCFGWASPRTIH